ncbi:MAG TPA: FecR family protein [Petrimonas sp.]|uniref:FecR family protein n=1 Tax=Petrimonas sp. TaxID=2023866 RepID=UPI00174FEAE3|nr:FecR family protein [Petrimonas sp.]HHV85979.1 FecR family protein [Petrimonas sp.]
MHILDKKTIEKVISGTSTKENAREVADWFSSSVEGQQYLSDMLDKDAFLMEEEPEDFQNTISPYRSDVLLSKINRQIVRKKTIRLALSVAAVLLPLILITGFMVQLSNRYDLFGNSRYSEIYVPKGEKMQILFQDGSRAYLNSDTRLRYPEKFALLNREIFLEGEAYFQVASNKKRPFIVNTGETSVKVLGTSFNVNAYKDNKEIRVVLDEGEILFAARNNEYRLNPGQKFIYNTDNKQLYLVNVRNSGEESLWKSNYIRLNDTPLRETLEILDRKFNIPFKVIDNKALAYSFNLLSEDKSLNYILSELEKIAPVKFVEVNDTINVKCLK